MRWLAILLVLIALPARAQDIPATLIADAIRFDGPTETITAEGNVEVFFDGALLRASTIRFDGRAGILQIEGPMTLIDADGVSVYIADFAELSQDMQDGVLRSARLVLDRRLQIAATEIQRSEGRYTQAYQTVASSCEVCADNPRPLWEIRARRVIHDAEEQMLWFENAQFRALGVPIVFIPRLRLPDPTVERARGFLVPRIFSNDTLGTGAQLPYFIPIGNSRDVTLSPYLTSTGLAGSGLRYRQSFTRGWIELNSQLSFDDMTDDAFRGYVFGEGFFLLPRDYELDLALQAVSDRGYLTTYGISDADRLESFAILSRAERDEYIELGVTEYFSLRDDEDNNLMPNTILDSEWTRRWDMPVIGGIARLSFNGHVRQRDDTGDMTGRDLARIGAEAGWRGDAIGPAGIVLAAEAELHADFFAIDQDTTYETAQTRIAPFAAVELSWPWARSNPNGVTHLITPRVQLAWSDASDAVVPNGDSAIVSFDEANLFALNRFPGGDLLETGARGAAGLSYSRSDPDGWSVGATIGRVWREEDPMVFTTGSGLDGTHSDWLVAINFSIGPGLSVINRALVSDTFSYTSNEAAISWTGNRHDLTGTVTWLAADGAEGRPEDTAELFLAGGYDIGQNWRTEADWRYDFATYESTRAGLGLTYTNECVELQFSLSRRFTSSDTVAPSTAFGLTVSLDGFGASREGRSQARVCRN